MKKNILILLFIPAIISCGQNFCQHEDLSTVNKTLLNKVSDVIRYVDSLSIVRPNYGPIKSILITFSESENRCYISIKGDFSYYDSKAMDGYFFYKNKAVSVYGSRTKCGNNFFMRENLKNGKIEGLIDYHYIRTDKNDKPNPPIPPPPPRESYFRKYLVINKDSLILVQSDN